MRGIIHIEDVCNIILVQIKKIKTIHNSTFNIGGGLKNSISLKNLTERCIKLTGNKISIKKIKETSNYDIPYYVSNNDKVLDDKKIEISNTVSTKDEKIETKFN